MALPTPSTPGYTSYTDAYGRKWTCCTCVKAWLYWYERLLKAKGLIKSNIDVWQLTGGATASAGTHSQGGAIDLLYQTTDAHIKWAREMGAWASWRRTTAQGFSKVHSHIVLTGCPHNSPARYQISAVRAGYNGLGTNGRGGPDTHPDPSVDRTYLQGIEYAKKALGLMATATKTAITLRPEVNVRLGLTEVQVSTSPAAPGTHVFEFSTDGTTWREFARKSVVVGKTTLLPWRFGSTHLVRARFISSDTTKFTSSTSVNKTTTAIDLLQTRDRANDALNRVAALEKRVTALEAAVPPKAPDPDPAFGIDVSKYQTPEAVKAHLAKPDYQFCIINSTTGLKTVSSALATNLEIARASGDLVGFYHWSQTINENATTPDKSDPVGEARHFVGTVKPKIGDILALDHEEALGTWEQRVAYAVAWLEEVFRLTGARPLVYVNWNWIKGLRTAATADQWKRLTAFPLWLAEWTKVPGQFSTVTSKDGINPDSWRILVHQYDVVDNMDLDWTPDMNELRKIAVTKAPSDTTPPPAGQVCTSPKFVTSDSNGGISDGGFYVHNNLWNLKSGSSGKTEVCSFRSWNHLANVRDSGDHAVQTYPNVHKDLSNRTIASFARLNSSFEMSSPDVGIYNVAYDFWINGVPNEEVMIWTDNYRQTPAGSKRDTVTISGTSWDVYSTSGNGYIAFVPANGVRIKSGSLDLKAFLTYLVDKGMKSSTDTVDQICYGIEIVDTAGSSRVFNLTNFSLTE